MAELPRLRTVNQLYEDIHILDEKSPISKNYLKKICKDIPCVSVGVKKMYDQNIVFEHIRSSLTVETALENI